MTQTAPNGRYGTARGWNPSDGAPRYSGASVQQGDGMTLCGKHAADASDFARSMQDAIDGVGMVKRARPFLIHLYGASTGRCQSC